MQSSQTSSSQALSSIKLDQRDLDQDLKMSDKISELTSRTNKIEDGIVKKAGEPSLSDIKEAISEDSNSQEMKSLEADEEKIRKELLTAKREKIKML